MQRIALPLADGGSVLVVRFGLPDGSGLWDLVAVVERDCPQADLTRPWPQSVLVEGPALSRPA